MASSPDAAHYVDSNIGIALDLSEPDAAETVNANVGFAIVLSAEATGGVNANIGLGDTRSGEGHQYAYEGDVDTSTPTPHIWWITPTSGRDGDGISIIGHGFGQTQAEYDGLAQWRPDFAVDDWTNLAVTGWVRVAAGAEAYTANRMLDPVTGRIDMEHGVIDFVIPEEMEEPGHQLRVVTDGT